MVMTGRFNYQRRPVLLRFEDMPGLEVVMAPVAIGTLMDMAGLADQPAAGPQLIDMFASKLQSWNLDVDGQPVPATAEGVRSLDPQLLLTIFRLWFDGLTQTPKAPPKPYGNGGIPAEVSLPMETLPYVPVS